MTLFLPTTCSVSTIVLTIVYLQFVLTVNKRISNQIQCNTCGAIFSFLNKLDFIDEWRTEHDVVAGADLWENFLPQVCVQTLALKIPHFGGF